MILSPLLNLVNPNLNSYFSYVLIIISLIRGVISKLEYNVLVPATDDLLHIYRPPNDSQSFVVELRYDTVYVHASFVSITPYMGQLEQHCVSAYSVSLFSIDPGCKPPPDCHATFSQKLDHTWYGSNVFLCVGHTDLDLYKENFFYDADVVDGYRRSLTNHDFSLNTHLNTVWIKYERTFFRVPSYLHSMWEHQSKHLKMSYELVHDWHTIYVRNNNLEKLFSYFSKISQSKRFKYFDPFSQHYVNLTHYWQFHRECHIHVDSCKEYIPYNETHSMCLDIYDFESDVFLLGCSDCFLPVPDLKKYDFTITVNAAKNIISGEVDNVKQAIIHLAERIEKLVLDALVEFEELLIRVFERVVRAFMKMLDFIFKEIFLLLKRFLKSKFFAEFIELLLMIFRELLTVLYELSYKFPLMETLITFLSVSYYTGNNPLAVTLALIVFSLLLMTFELY